MKLIKTGMGKTGMGKTGMGKTGMGKTGMGKTGMGKDFVMPLKSNRNIALSGQDKKDGRFQERRALSRKTGAFKQSKRSNTRF